MAADKKVVLRPHDPNSGARHTLPIEYDSEAKAPEFRKALKAIFNGANDPDGLRRFIAELFGYVIQPRRNMACIVIFVGKGANGKTKLVELMMKLLGEGLVYSGRMEELDAGRFSLGALFGKYLFVDDDIKSGTKLPDGVLKKISEEKLITGEQKYRDHFEFTCRTVPILLCNNIPTLSDLSHGMMRRLHVIQFKNVFEGEDVDRSLFDRIQANELSGVLNFALGGWRRLERLGAFTLPSDMAKAKDELVAYANPLQGFLTEMCERDAKARTTLMEFYTRYTNWASDNGFSLKQSLPVVRRNLEHLGFNIPSSQPGAHHQGAEAEAGFFGNPTPLTLKALPGHQTIVVPATSPQSIPKLSMIYVIDQRF